MRFENSQEFRFATRAGLAVLLAIAGWVPAASAQSTPASEEVQRLASFWVVDRFEWDNHQTPEYGPKLAIERLAKASKDECFNGVGVAASQPPCNTGTPKANQAYVWGLTRAGNNLFFGTVANTHCLVEAGMLGNDSPQQNEYWVCEFSHSTSGTGDWRPPDLWRYDLNAKALVSLNPPAGSLPDMLRHAISGFRSAGSGGGVSFIAGPAFTSLGVVMFAFDSETGALLGVQSFPAYNDVRSWVNNGAELYVGMGNVLAGPGSPGGSVLRWTGSRSIDPAELFRFEVVGEMASSAANLAVHNGRIYVSTWPTGDRLSGLVRGPLIPAGGLTTANKDQWTQIWSVLDYERDPVVAMTYGGGAIASFGGSLFWGTMHVPFVASAYASQAFDLDANGNGTVDDDESLATMLGTHRSIALFEGRNLETKPAVNIVYGETYQPRYDPARKLYTIAADDFHRNGMGKTPRFGASGLGNFFNAYLWSMQVFDRSLYLGTFDWTQVARVMGESESTGLPPDQQAALLQLLDLLAQQEGADLCRLDARNEPAIAESLTGLRNPTNYGVRTMARTDTALIVGTANPMNLHPDGGWELLRLRRGGQNQQ